MTHHLKTWPEYFEDVLSGIKKFEIRNNDRGFKVGDELRLGEFIPGGLGFTGRVISAHVTYLVKDPMFTKEGFCVMGLGGVLQIHGTAKTGKD